MRFSLPPTIEMKRIAIPGAIANGECFEISQSALKIHLAEAIPPNIA
jgi:hypothetical protein